MFLLPTLQEHGFGLCNKRTRRRYHALCHAGETRGPELGNSGLHQVGGTELRQPGRMAHGQGAASGSCTPHPCQGRQQCLQVEAQAGQKALLVSSTGRELQAGLSAALEGDRGKVL